jgi:N-methylhydantoinase A
VSIERGRDPRNYAMIAFGGAGPLHAARVARKVGIPRVIVPHGAGVGSAIGLLQAEPRLDVTVTRVIRLDDADAADRLASVYEALEHQARREVDLVSPGASVSWTRYAQLRYAGQGFEVHVDLPIGAIDWDYLSAVEEAFGEAYLRRNKFVDSDGVVEGVDWSLVANLNRPLPDSIRSDEEKQARSDKASSRQCWFPESNGFAETRILSRQDLTAGMAIAGPAIVEDPDCTAVVPPGDTVSSNPDGHLVIEIGQEKSR